MRHKNYPSNFDYLVPPRADTHIPNRSAGQILQAIDIRSGRRRQIRKPSDVRQPLLPTRYHLIDRLDSRDRLHVGGHAIDLLSVQPIAHSDRYLGKRVQDIQLRHRESGEPIHPDCVPDHDGVKPSASPRPPRRRAKLASEFPNPLGAPPASIPSIWFAASTRARTSSWVRVRLRRSPTRTPRRPYLSS